MTDDHRNTVSAVLMTDALEACGGHNASAAMLLVDAGLCILLNSLPAAGAREMAGHIGKYCRDQVEFVLAKGGAA